MRTIKKLLIFIFMALVSMSGFSMDDEAAIHFSKGQMLIGKNCGECVGSSKNGLEDGLSELLLAENNGYLDKTAVLKLMYKTYNDIAYYFTEPYSVEMNRYLDLRQQVAEKLFVLLPDDPMVLESYAERLLDKDKQLKIWQKILILSPQNFGIRLKVGLRLTETGKLDQGLQELKRTVNDTSPDMKDIYRERAIEGLDQYGYKTEAAEWRKQATTQNQPLTLPQTNK